MRWEIRMKVGIMHVKRYFQASCFCCFFRAFRFNRNL